MVDYTCECCGHVFEIEEYQAVMAPPEHYEHGLCADCFDKDIEEDKGMKMQSKAPEDYIAVDMPTMAERAAAVCMDCGKPGGQICADCEEAWLESK